MNPGGWAGTHKDKLEPPSVSILTSTFNDDSDLQEEMTCLLALQSMTGLGAVCLAAVHVHR